MKRLILISMLFLSKLSSVDKVNEKEFLKSINEDEYSFILVLQSSNENYNLARFNLNQLRKCNFPSGPLRSNCLPQEDFLIISDQMIDNIKQLVDQKKCFELPVFCVGCQSNERCKTCGFELPEKGKLSFVFEFTDDIQQLNGFVISNSNFDELISTSTFMINGSSSLLNDPDDDDEPDDDTPVVPYVDDPSDKPIENETCVKKLKKMLQSRCHNLKITMKELVVNAFIRYVDLRESVANSYNKLSNSLSKLNDSSKT